MISVKLGTTMRRFFFVPLISVFMLLVSQQVCAEKIVLVTGEYSPYTSEKLEGGGFFTKLVTAVLNEMGKDFEYRFYPWRRCENNVEAGIAWAAFPYVENEDRLKTFIFSDEVIEVGSKFFYYGDKMKTVTWKKLSDLKPYTLGGVMGYWYEAEFKKQGLTIDYSVKEISGLKKLKAGRIDLFPSDELVAWTLIKQEFSGIQSRFGTIDNNINATSLRLMVNKSTPESKQLLNEFNTALKIIKKKPRYKKILADYNLN